MSHAPVEVFHPIEFIVEECDARGWTLRDLAEQMGDDVELNMASLAFYALKKPCITLDPNTAGQLSRAFGTSPELWLNLHTAWAKGRPA